MQKLLNEISFYIFQLRQNFRNQQALRGSFFVVVIGGILGQMSIYVIWIMFSRAIGTVNGWGMVQTFGMISTNMLAFGLCHGAFGSTRMLHTRIQTGSLDGLLTKPKNLYVRIINSEAMMAAVGWLLQGGMGMAVFFYLTGFDIGRLACYLVMLPPAVAVQVGYLMVTDCISFWLPQAGDLNRSLNEMFFTSANQPLSLLHGPLRIMYIVAIPALLVAGFPVEFVTYYQYKLIPTAYVVAISWLALSVWVLNISLRRYESGNVIG